MTDNFDLYMQDCKEEQEKNKLAFEDYFKIMNSNYYNKNYDTAIINNINYLFSFYPFKDYSLILECTQEIANLYENIKNSKYNSAVQKFFIQLKEIKYKLISEKPKEINRNINENINMIIEN